MEESYVRNVLTWLQHCFLKYIKKRIQIFRVFKCKFSQKIGCDTCDSDNCNKPKKP